MIARLYNSITLGMLASVLMFQVTWLEMRVNIGWLFFRNCCSAVYVADGHKAVAENLQYVHGFSVESCRVMRGRLLSVRIREHENNSCLDNQRRHHADKSPILNNQHRHNHYGCCWTSGSILQSKK